MPPSRLNMTTMYVQGREGCVAIGVGLADFPLIGAFHFGGGGKSVYVKGRGEAVCAVRFGVGIVCVLRGVCVCVDAQVSLWWACACAWVSLWRGRLMCMHIASPYTHPPLNTQGSSRGGTRAPTATTATTGRGTTEGGTAPSTDPPSVCCEGDGLQSLHRCPL